MSNASDRNDRPEDLANFGPKWARDPALREKRDASRLAADESRHGEPDEAPPIAPSGAHRDADVADLRLAREAHYVSRRRGDEFPGRGAFASDERASDSHRMSR